MNLGKWNRLENEEKRNLFTISVIISIYYNLIITI